MNCYHANSSSSFAGSSMSPNPCPPQWISSQWHRFDQLPAPSGSIPVQATRENSLSPPRVTMENPVSRRLRRELRSRSHSRLPLSDPNPTVRVSYEHIMGVRSEPPKKRLRMDMPPPQQMSKGMEKEILTPEEAPVPLSSRTNFHEPSLSPVVPDPPYIANRPLSPVFPDPSRRTPSLVFSPTSGTSSRTASIETIPDLMDVDVVVHELVHEPSPQAEPRLHPMLQQQKASDATNPSRLPPERRTFAQPHPPVAAVPSKPKQTPPPVQPHRHPPVPVPNRPPAARRQLQLGMRPSGASGGYKPSQIRLPKPAASQSRPVPQVKKEMTEYMGVKRQQTSPEVGKKEAVLPPKAVSLFLPPVPDSPGSDKLWGDLGALTDDEWRGISA